MDSNLSNNSNSKKAKQKRTSKRRTTKQTTTTKQDIGIQWRKRRLHEAKSLRKRQNECVKNDKRDDYSNYLLPSSGNLNFTLREDGGLSDAQATKFFQSWKAEQVRRNQTLLAVYKLNQNREDVKAVCVEMICDMIGEDGANWLTKEAESEWKRDNKKELVNQLRQFHRDLSDTMLN
eukprot:g6390.t1